MRVSGSILTAWCPTCRRAPSLHSLRAWRATWRGLCSNGTDMRCSTYPFRCYTKAKVSRSSTPQGSLPAFASGNVATRIHPATGWHSLFPTPIPASSLVDLAVFLPSTKERYGLTTFHKIDKNGLGTLCSPVALGVHGRVLARPCSRYGALLAQADKHLWPVAFYDVYREFMCVHHTIHPVPSPPDAGRYAVPSRFWRQSGDCGYVVRGLLTARYLAAVPRRILLMEQ